MLARDGINAADDRDVGPAGQQRGEMLDVQLAAPGAVPKRLKRS